MSPLECVEPAIQGSSIADSPRDRLEQAHREPSEAVSNQGEAEFGSSSEESEPEEVRHVGPCHLGLALNGFLKRHTEGPWEYLPGGHHPVHLGDRIGEYKQFKVIHKLGSGGFGIVWLCSWVGTDPTIYVAIKILKAEWSGEDCREQENIRWLQGIADRDPDVEEWCLLPWQEFTLDGPNGTHQCFVYEVAASGLGNISHVVDDVDAFLRKLTRQAAEAMSVLHRHNICHGDFRPSNILFRVNGLDGKSEEEVIDILGEPEGAAVVVYKNAPLDAHPPRYILNPVSWRSTTSTQVCCHQIRIADFGESFIAGNPPPHGSGIPFQYAAPEVALDEKAGKESDIFALAATMYEIRFGNRLFRIQEDSVEAYVHFMVKYCGRLPEPWWSRWKETWKKVTEPANEEELQDESTVKLWHIRKAVCEPIGHRVSTPESWAYPHKSLGRNGVIGCHELIPVKEKVYLADLLYRMTALDPRERITIDEVLEHCWFRYEAENAEPVRPDEVKERKDDLSQIENTDSDAPGDQAIIDELPQPADPDKPQKIAEYNLPQLETNHTGIHNNSPTAEAETAETFAVQPALVETDKSMNIDRPEQSKPAERETPPSTGASELQPPEEQKAEVLSLNIPLIPAADAIRLPEPGKPQYAATVALQPVEDAKLIYVPTNLSPVHEVSESTSSAVESFRSVKAVKSIPTPAESAQAEEESTARSAVVDGPQQADEKPLLNDKQRGRQSRLRPISIRLRSVGRAVRALFA
ncbi:kinase-like domain-containing protein [Aspergillus foveolatus]|uniref:kinase-like domain-containing protein n=1 Tax=Aspergillus foveolatus TaxID=210207 RepID=UPI003CCDA9CB